MTKIIDESWRDWTTLNLSRGCSKKEIIQILLDNGFSPENIIHTLKNHPDASELAEMVHEASNKKIQNIGNAQLLSVNHGDSTESIDSIILPLANRVETDRAHIYTLDHFLSPDECQALVELIRRHFRPSTITNQDEADKTFRTSQTCDLGVLENQLLVEEINQRISEYMGIETERGEPIQGQYYQVGQQFKTHTDYFEPGTEEYEKFAKTLGQRTWTFMIYLNEVEAGGETEFPELKTVIKPSPGKAVIWNSIHPSGAVNPASAHWAKPIIKGEKFVITKWFRTYGGLNYPYQAPPRKNLPIFSKEGFKKLTIQPELYDELRLFYESEKHRQIKETSDAVGTYIKSSVNSYPSQMIELTETLRNKILCTLTPQLEAWVKRPLNASVVYGIRSYQRGSSLSMHADRIETHQVSAILNVAQKVDTDWDLHIHDHKGKLHKVKLNPGEMIFYESARLNHGRPTPLDGEYYANVFAHTFPSNVNPS